jgi:AAA15 family ATPase/GTPase
MINSLTIRNFKSIKDLTVNCKRINLFIGEPNTGKSNILEAMGLLSWLVYAKVGTGQKNSQDSHKLIVPPQQYYTKLFDFIRFIGVQDIFLDGLIDDKVEILIKKERAIGIEMKLKSGFVILEKKAEKTGKKSNKNQEIIQLDYKGDVTEISSTIKDFSSIKFYRFVKQQFYFPFNTSSYLLPPSGLNLFSLVMSNKKLREIMTNFYRESDLTLVLKPQNMTFEIQSQRENFVFNYPYISVSDTLQRIIFYLIAMESNENSTLIFEEPESYAFPYFTRYLGERIALYDANQYFISTHNPYLLQSILEKADKKEVNVFVTFIEDFRTKVVKLTSDQISSEILDADPFFNLDKFTDRGDE